MNRTFEKELFDWKENNIHTPLMVIGARQTGKTFILDKFCKENFEEYIYINLEREEGIASIFEETINPQEIIRNIEIKLGKTIDLEKTILFFDEIQVSERAITSLKYFCEDATYKIVCAGSLLGVKINRFSSSFPVGKVIIKYLYPMDFEEFLLATGNQNLALEIRRCFDKKEAMLETIHNQAIKEYQTYLCIGGMPAAIKNYIDNNKSIMAFDREIHANIITAYIADMRKYTISPEETIKIQSIYESMPMQLGKDNKKFKYSIIQKGGNRRQYELPLDWLLSSNMLIKSQKISLPEMPLKAYEDIDAFKIYLSDVGLLNYLAKVNFSNILDNSDFIFKGAITENYVAQTLLSKKYDLFYWRSNFDAEIDFILQKEVGIIPIEVKASINTKSKSLNEYMQKYQTNYAIRISMKNFGFMNNIFSVPLYAVHLI